MQILDPAALRDALRYFVGAGTLVVELHPLLCSAEVSVAVAAERSGQVWLGARRDLALSRLLRCSSGVQVRFDREGRQLALAGTGRAALGVRLVDHFAHPMLTECLGLGSSKRMMIRVDVLCATLCEEDLRVAPRSRGAPWQSASALEGDRGP